MGYNPFRISTGRCLARRRFVRRKLEYLHQHKAVLEVDMRLTRRCVGALYSISSSLRRLSESVARGSFGAQSGG
jgi:pilus assembly protein TadC